jgi:hypothetical protein
VVSGGVKVSRGAVECYFSWVSWCPLTIKVHNAPSSSAGWVCEATVVARHDNCGGIHKVLGWVIGQLSEGAAQQGEGKQLHFLKVFFVFLLSLKNDL